MMTCVLMACRWEFVPRGGVDREQGYARDGKARLILTGYGMNENELSVQRQVVGTSMLQGAHLTWPGEVTEAPNERVQRVEPVVHPQPFGSLE